jgi:hypothetical protein
MMGRFWSVLIHYSAFTWRDGGEPRRTSVTVCLRDVPNMRELKYAAEIFAGGFGADGRSYTSKRTRNNLNSRIIVEKLIVVKLITLL